MVNLVIILINYLKKIFHYILINAWGFITIKCLWGTESIFEW